MSRAKQKGLELLHQRTVKNKIVIMIWNEAGMQGLFEAKSYTASLWVKCVGGLHVKRLAKEPEASLSLDVHKHFLRRDSDKPGIERWNYLGSQRSETHITYYLCNNLLLLIHFALSALSESSNSKKFLTLPKRSPLPALCYAARYNQRLQDFIFYYFTVNISAWDTANQSDYGCPVVRWHVKLY